MTGPGFNSISPEVSNFALEQNTCDFVSYTLLNNVEQHVQIYHEKKNDTSRLFMLCSSCFENINIIKSKIQP